MKKYYYYEKIIIFYKIKVILCTDGLANQGLGALDIESDISNQFYEEVGNYAK